MAAVRVLHGVAMYGGLVRADKARSNVVMHVDIIPNRGSRPAYLLRESYREGARVRKRTLANLSSLCDEQICAIRAILRGERLAPATGLFEALASRAHGAVQAVRCAMQRLGFARLIGTRPSGERDLVCAMVVARILAPHPKLATTRWWHTTTLAQELVLSTPTRTICMARWTGCSSARGRSSRNWPSVT